MNNNLCPVFVISLKDEEKRRRQMKEKLEALGLPFVFFDAIDGRNFDVPAHPAYNSVRRRRCYGRDMTGGEIGCLLSHKAIFEKMLQDNIEEALILEDDAVLAPDFPAVLRALPDCPVNFDIVRFLGSPKVEKRHSRRIYPVIEDFWLVRMPTTPGGAHAYFIRKSGARKLLAHMDRNAFPIDTLIGRSWETGAEVLSVKPGLATQDLSFDSAIGEQRFDKKLKLEGWEKITFPLTRAGFKLAETVGKRKIYWSRIFKDLRWRIGRGKNA